MRLIDADRIVYSWHIDADGEEHDGITLQSIINKMPTIDAVEVVRCKNCKRVDTPRCPFYRAGWGYTDDDFCSCGERGDSDDES